MTPASGKLERGCGQIFRVEENCRDPAGFSGEGRDKLLLFKLGNFIDVCVCVWLCAETRACLLLEI